jgi:hypothetical protein
MSNRVPSFRFCAAAAAGILCSASGWADDGFHRYEVILLRKPFGETPIEEPPPVEPVSTEASFAKNLRICSMTQPEGSGIKVGIVDAAAKKSYVLRVGETDGGITLVSADMLEEQAVLQVGTEVGMIKLAASQTPAPRPNPRATPADGARAASYADRRQERREARTQPEPQRREMPQPRYTGEELQEHLRNYNMEAIRQGLPALPIELTPEQDAQLVAEGLLAPTEGAPPAAIAAPPPPPPPAAEAAADAPAWTRESIGDIPIDQLTTEELNLLESLMQQQP